MPVRIKAGLDYPFYFFLSSYQRDVQLQSGYPVQPQNWLPALSPVFAFINTGVYGRAFGNRSLPRPCCSLRTLDPAKLTGFRHAPLKFSKSAAIRPLPAFSMRKRWVDF
jgi:hypothetical protein